MCAGAELAYDEVEQILPRNTCALIKSFMGFKLGKVCPYLEEADLLVGETTCDGKKKAYELLGELHNVYVMELPQMKRDEGHRVLARRDRRPHEQGRGDDRQEGHRRVAHGVHQGGQRQAPRAAAHRRRPAPPIPSPISGKDALLATQVAFYDDVPRFTQMMNALADELEQRVADGVGVAPAGAKRVLITGTPMALPNWKLHDIIEKSGGVVVGEEMCTGSRYYEDLVSEDAATLDEMIDDIADEVPGHQLRVLHAQRGPHRRRHPHGQGPRAPTASSTTRCNFCGTYQIEAATRREGGPGRGLPGPAHRDRLLDGGRRSALHARRGVPRDALGPSVELGATGC